MFFTYSIYNTGNRKTIGKDSFAKIFQNLQTLWSNTIKRRVKGIKDKDVIFNLTV
jgi:hypothetical protein